MSGDGVGDHILLVAGAKMMGVVVFDDAREQLAGHDVFADIDEVTRCGFDGRFLDDTGEETVFDAEDAVAGNVLWWDLDG